MSPAPFLFSPAEPRMTAPILRSAVPAPRLTTTAPVTRDSLPKIEAALPELSEAAVSVPATVKVPEVVSIAPPVMVTELTVSETPALSCKAPELAIVTFTALSILLLTTSRTTSEAAPPVPSPISKPPTIAEAPPVFANSSLPPFTTTVPSSALLAELAKRKLPHSQSSHRQFFVQDHTGGTTDRSVPNQHFAGICDARDLCGRQRHIHVHRVDAGRSQSSTPARSMIALPPSVNALPGKRDRIKRRVGGKIVV